MELNDDSKYDSAGLSDAVGIKDWLEAPYILGLSHPGGLTLEV